MQEEAARKDRLVTVAMAARAELQSSYQAMKQSAMDSERQSRETEARQSMRIERLVALNSSSGVAAGSLSLSRGLACVFTLLGKPRRRVNKNTGVVDFTVENPNHVFFRLFML